MPDEVSIPTEQLPQILYNFYSEVRKKNVDDDDNDGSYKTQTLKCIR